MPRKKNYRRRNRRRYKKKNIRVRTKGPQEVVHTGTNKYKSVVYKGIGIPDAYFTKLKYSANIVLSGVPYDEYLFRLNGVFDPDATGVGGQPLYYDQIVALYQKYCVLGCQISATFVNRTATGESSFQKVGIYAQSVASSASNIRNAVERDACVYSQLGPNSGDQGVVTMNSFAKPWVIAGLNKFEKQDDVMTAEFSALPARQQYWHIFAGTNDETNGITCHVSVTLTYYVKFFERKSVGAS